MIKLFLNQAQNLLLCAVSHTDVAVLHKAMGQVTLPDELRNASYMRQQRAIAHQAGYWLISQLWASDVGCYSVSHSKNITLLLYNQDPGVRYCGVDIEYLSAKKRVRGFMQAWLLRQPITNKHLWEMKRLTTILFCCMESVYKALSPYQLFTFQVEDYQLLHITHQYCLLSYLGDNVNKSSLNICCYYLEVDSYIISCTLLNAQRESVNNGCSFNIKTRLN